MNSSNNNKGFTLFTRSGELYYICKSEDQPDECVGLPVNDIQNCEASSAQFVENFDQFKNDPGFLDRLYDYLHDNSYIQSSITESDMIASIAEKMASSHLLAFHIENNTPLFKHMLKEEGEKPIELVLQEKEKKELYVRFIPVRYALDEFQPLIKAGKDKDHDLLEIDEDKVMEPHGLPPSFPGGYFRKDRSGKIEESQYTLRQLPDGFLYIWDEVCTQMHEYKVTNKGGKTLLTRYVFGDSEYENDKGERGTATDYSEVYLEYPVRSILHIVYSRPRWSWRLIERFRGDAVHPNPKIQSNARKKATARRKAWARKIVCSSLYAAHTGEAKDVLPMVSDIDASDENTVFPYTVPSITTSQATLDDISYSIEGYPFQLSAPYLSALKAKAPTLDGKEGEIKVSQVVALDNIYSDINDMVSQINYLHTHLYEILDGEMEWRATALATVELCGGGVDDEILPENVRGDEMKVRIFQLDLIELFKNIKQYKDALLSNSMTAGFFQKQKLDKYEEYFKDKYFTPPDIDAQDAAYLEVEQQFEQKYFQDLTRYNRWLTHQKKNRNLSKQTALEEVITHLKHDQAVMELMIPRVNELFKCLMMIPSNGAAWLGFDTTLTSDQRLLADWIENCFDVMLPHLDDERRKILEDEVFVNDHAKSILGVSLSGYEPEIRDKLTEILKPLQEHIDTKAKAAADYQDTLTALNENIDPNAKAAQDAQKIALNKDRADTLLIINDIYASSEAYGLFAHKWVELLSPNAKKAMLAMRGANSQSQSLGKSLLHATTISAGNNGVAKPTSSLKIFLVDSYMSEGGKKALYKNENYFEERKNWDAQYKKVYADYEPIQTELNKLNAEVAKLNGQNDRLKDMKGKPNMKIRGGVTRKTIQEKIQKQNAMKLTRLEEEIKVLKHNLKMYKPNIDRLEDEAAKLQKFYDERDKLTNQLTEKVTGKSREQRKLQREGILGKIKFYKKNIKAAAPDVEAFRVKRIMLKAAFPKPYISSPSMIDGSESKILDEAIKEAVKNPKKTNWSGTGFTVGAVILNFVNLYLVQKSTPEYEDIDLSFFSDSSNAFDTFATISATAYLGQAMTLLFSSASDRLIEQVMKSPALNPKDLTDFYKIRITVGSDSKAILQISSKDMIEGLNEVDKKKFLSLLQRTKIFYRLLGTFTVFGTVYEMVPLYHNTFGRKGDQLNGLEKTLSVIKISSLAVSVVSGFYSLGMGGVLAGFAWAGPLFAAVSVIYIISAFLLDYIKRDEYERWLDNCRYGNAPLWINDIDTEYQQLLFLMMNPSVYVQPTYFLRKSNKGGQMGRSIRVKTGYYVMLKLPEPHCQIEVAEVIPEFMGMGTKGNFNMSAMNFNTSLIMSDPIWLTEFQYNMVMGDGLPNDINANNIYPANIADEETPKGSLLCLLRLPLTDTVDGSFILRIIRPGGEMIWEYDIDRSDLTHGKIIKDTYKGDAAWPSDIIPVKLTTDVNECC